MKKAKWGPLIPYYGAKWRSAGAYPKPQHKRIVEPFAGGGGYSIYHATEDTLIDLFDVSPLISGVSPVEADALLDSIGAAASDEPEALPGPVGYAMGFTGSAFFPPVFHRWEGRYMSACRRWKADAATGPFRPCLEDEKACRECAA